MRVTIAVLSIGVCLAVAACGKSDNNKTVTYSGGNGTVTMSSSGNNEHVVVHSTNGNATMEFNANGMGHVNMPAFAPLFPGAKVTSSIDESSATGGGAMVAFTTSSSPGDVIAFYKQKSLAAGLASTLDMSSGDNQTYVASKDRLSVQVIAAKSADGTHASITWATGK